MVIIPHKIQSISFIMAIVIYSLWGSPTPDIIGAAEYIMAFLLLVSIRWEGILRQKTLACLLCIGALAPSCMAYIYGNAGAPYMRDVIALGFLFLPLFYMRTIQELGDKFFPLLAWVGCVFSCRALIPYSDILSDPTRWGAGQPADLLYLANSPEVLFAGLYGVYLIIQACLGKAGPVTGVAGAFMCGLTSLAMTMMLQRAGLVLMAIYMMMGVAWLFYQRPLRGILLGCMAVAIFFVIQNVVGIVGETLWQKTMMVGVNGRIAEWQTVLTLISSSFFTMLFGYGWGYQFENPAVGGLPVGFTHALLSFLLVKSGVIGLLAILAGMIGMVTGFSVWWRNIRPYFLLTLILPLFIAVFLYASYKSLGFGLILCGIGLILQRTGDDRIRKLEKMTPPVA